MPNIFSLQSGVVAQLTGPSLPMTVGLTNWGGFSALKCIITGLSIQQQSAVQFMLTLNQYIYIYNFGERIGDATISGMAFIANCSDKLTTTGSDAAIIGPIGLDNLINYYKTNRVSTTGQPLTISFGMTAIKAFLLGMRAEIVDPSSGLAQFVMQFKFPPV